jgi:hypothetical protein
MNDAGTIVWEASDEAGSATWHLFQAVWGLGDRTRPEIAGSRSNAPGTMASEPADDPREPEGGCHG